MDIRVAWNRSTRRGLKHHREGFRTGAFIPFGGGGRPGDRTKKLGSLRIGLSTLHPAAWGLLLCAALLLPLRAAPLPAVGKVDIEGMIEKATWKPEKKLKAVKGMSGSAGRNRTLPAHFVVVLKDFSGPTAKQAGMLNSFVGGAGSGGTVGGMPSKLTVWINSGDPADLKPGMRVRLSGYTVTGDEGGTWAHHEGVRILPEANR